MASLPFLSPEEEERSVVVSIDGWKRGGGGLATIEASNKTQEAAARVSVETTAVLMSEYERLSPVSGNVHDRSVPLLAAASSVFVDCEFCDLHDFSSIRDSMWFTDHQNKVPAKKDAVTPYSLVVLLG